MATWESFLKRRNLKARDYIERNSLKTIEEFLIKIRSIGLEDPPQHVLDALFPEHKETQILANHENNGLQDSKGSEVETKTVKKTKSKTKIQSEVEE